MAHRHLNPDSPWLLGLLAALVAMGPLSVDMYLPAMPLMMRALGTDIGHMHLTLSSYLTGFAVFHLACGPLADRFGRKPVLTGGTLIFVAACIGCAQSTTVEELLAFRFLQGVGACVGPTLARTVTRDIFGPRRAARALSLIAMLMAVGCGRTNTGRCSLAGFTLAGHFPVPRLLRRTDDFPVAGVSFGIASREAKPASIEHRPQLHAADRRPLLSLGDPGQRRGL